MPLLIAAASLGLFTLMAIFPAVHVSKPTKACFVPSRAIWDTHGIRIVKSMGSKVEDQLMRMGGESKRIYKYVEHTHGGLVSTEYTEVSGCYA